MYSFTLYILLPDPFIKYIINILLLSPAYDSYNSTLKLSYLTAECSILN